MVLNPLVSLFGRLVARSGRKRGNRQTNGRNDRTLAAHARRGLTIDGDRRCSGKTDANTIAQEHPVELL